jgi:hypothetical protein
MDASHDLKKLPPDHGHAWVRGTKILNILVIIMQLGENLSIGIQLRLSANHCRSMSYLNITLKNAENKCLR